MFHIIQGRKQALDTLVCELGITVIEAVVDMGREEISGPECRPTSSGVYKWAYQRGSVYVGDQKVSVMCLCIRCPKGEISPESYTALKKTEAFSEDLLQKVLRGISLQRYKETVIDSACSFGVSLTSPSLHIVEVTAKKLAKVQGKRPLLHNSHCHLHGYDQQGRRSLRSCPARSSTMS